MQFEPLIEYRRGDLAEVVHTGAVAVVDAQGRLVASAGDPQLMCFSRSTLKPFQALPFVQGGGVAHFGFTPAQVALLCASHNGEDRHVEAVDDMLTKASRNHGVLQCGCHVPLRFTHSNTLPPAGMAFDERHHNCSGKHSGFIACCVQHGLSLDNYLQPDHPLQQEIRKQLACVMKCDESALIVGIDGCSAPNYAMPLEKLAFAYARLASGDADVEFGVSFATLRDAMLAHPEMVSGTGRNDLAFTQAGRGDWITKIGADGVQVVASVSRSQAVAVKIHSGHMPSLYAATLHVLAELGWIDAQQQAQLQPWFCQPLLNARGLRTGEMRAVPNLRRF